MTQELNERLAKKAGWIPGQDYGPAPNYVNSIDAQMRDLDPLVEKQYGRAVERFHPNPDGRWSCEMAMWPMVTPIFRGHGPTRAAARAAAIDQALKEEGND